MKKRILTFIGLALLALSVVPLINLKWGHVQKKPGEAWWHRAVLYNLDFALPYWSRALYSFGISTSPSQVTIGRDGWLYLGDQYEQTLTVTRRGSQPVDVETGKRIALATAGWEQWLASQGVQAFRVVVGPNKNTVYADMAPAWAQPLLPSATDTLIASMKPGQYVDVQPAMRKARTEFAQPLYYKTDTHWNQLGGWVAVRALGADMAQAASGLHWLSEQQVRPGTASQRYGGDLANFLKMSHMLHDSEVPVVIDIGRPVETAKYDFDTGRLLESGGNPEVGAPRTPVLVKSPNALNQKKVLWLRDSFGTAMSPYMAATFSETLQIHYGVTDAAMVVKLVEKYRPDYVFVTVVERDARALRFEQVPPLLVSAKPANFLVMARGTESSANDVAAIPGSSAYRVAGGDAFIAFKLAPAVRAADASRLTFKLDCGDKSVAVPMQLFWYAEGSHASEASSVRFMATPGSNSVDLALLPAWQQAGNIAGLRLDLDAPGVCQTLGINTVELGR
ncbi:alginate O-acetyltransferase AlgX-related protein [Janthinobacterium sp. ZB1P44]|uniref:alginate O-acetyltransferase AlgX-related protein n=1 Tax=Janthinobacterium sp. ZB1P44 TaxID=3424192 RepID=UPI003F26FC4D